MTAFSFISPWAGLLRSPSAHWQELNGTLHGLKGMFSPQSLRNSVVQSNPILGTIEAIRTGGGSEIDKARAIGEYLKPETYTNPEKRGERIIAPVVAAVVTERIGAAFGGPKAGGAAAESTPTADAAVVAERVAIKKTAVEEGEVGLFGDLKGRSVPHDGLDIHEVPSSEAKIAA